jgi:GTP cyclohydrolase III
MLIGFTLQTEQRKTPTDSARETDRGRDAIGAPRRGYVMGLVGDMQESDKQAHKAHKACTVEQETTIHHIDSVFTTTTAKPPAIRSAR